MSSKLTVNVTTCPYGPRAIDAFRGKWEAVEQKNNRYLRELRRVATIESIGSSTRDEQEVFGYYEAVDLILDHAKGIDLTEAYIKQLHGILLRDLATLLPDVSVN